jgi:hypothetical protein
MGVFEVAPNINWTLDDWRSAAGHPSAVEMIRIGSALTGPLQVVEAIRHWRAGTVQTWFNRAIVDRDHAVAMITVLRHAAQNTGSTLFGDEHFRAHAGYFMQSKACRDGGFTPLSDDELAAIAGYPVPEADPRFDDHDLLRKVFPPPPIRPFGRESEIAHLLDVMRDSVVTVIVSDPGNGKTTLAWHTGRRAVQGGLVTAMDWNTDKRSMVTPSGEEKAVSLSGVPLKYEMILSSAVRRFGWDNLLLAPEHRLPALAAERLANGRYLLVVDNLETVPQASEMVTLLRGLLEPRGEFSPVASRALITSRVPVDDVPGVRNVPIGGLALEPASAFVRALENDNAFAKHITDTQFERLWLLTKGNPLLLQIALTRSMYQSGNFDEVLRDLENGDGFFAVFNHLIGPLVEMMDQANPKATFIAVYAALLPDQTASELRLAWDKEYSGDAAFESALTTAVRYGILRPLPGGEGEYAMHPMVRHYLRRLYSK